MNYAQHIEWKKQQEIFLYGKELTLPLPQLTDKQRIVHDMRWQGKEMRDVASHMKITRDAVRCLRDQIREKGVECP